MNGQISIASFFRKARWALAFYAGSLLLVWLGERVAPSDRCNPGLGFAYGLLLFPLLTLVLLTRSLFPDFGPGAPKKLSPRSGVHLLTIATLLLVLTVNA